jgi:hypothetical protein
MEAGDGREYSHKACSRGKEKQEMAQIHEAHRQKLLEEKSTKAGKSTAERDSRILCSE